MKNVNIILKSNYNELLKDFNFTLNEGNKVAIIGEEGNGKSTLLKLIYNKELIESYCEFSGEIFKKELKIGYLEQSLDSLWDDFSVNQYFLKDTIESDVDFNKYEDLNEIAIILSKLGIDSNMVYSEQLIKTLSGGEKIKIQLAKIILLKADLLLLDEPTNDLDIKTLKWLEDLINSCNVPVMFISHDETLLENTANVIIHIEQLKRKKESKYTIEKCSYRTYVEKRLGMIEHQEKVARKQREEYNSKMEKFRQTYQKVEYQQNTISRADPHGAALLKKKIKNLKSQEKRYEREKEEFLDIPDIEEAIGVSFDTNIYIPNSKKILDLNIDEIKVLNKVLAKNINLQINGPEHIVIVGTNGVGKSTLLKIIYEELKERKDIKVGYMPQNYEDLLNSDEKAIDFIKTGSHKEEVTKAMTYLGLMKFTREEMCETTSELSGGQKAKLLILKMILSNSNVLILDEPTRNLSPLSNPVIRKILSTYKGTIISVSHDRKFIEEVCDIIYELTKDGLIKHSSIRDLN